MRIKLTPRRTYVLSLLGFAAASLAVFAWFFVYGKTMVWLWDSLDQHFPALYFFNVWLRDFIHNPGAGLPLWSFNIGLGADIIGTLSFYVVGDPFALISLAFPMGHMEAAYTTALILRMVCTGAAALAYLRHMGAKTVPALIGTILYALAGFAIISVTRHPFFANALVFLPLVLLAVEWALERRHSWVLTIVAFLAAVGNFYFFYILTLITIIYAVARYFEITEKADRWRQLLPSALRLGGLFALGILMAAPILLPTLLAVLGTARGQEKYQLQVLYAAWEYRLLLSSLSAINGDTNFSFMGFSMLGFVMAPVVFLRRGKYAALKFILVAWVAFLTLPVFGSMFNGFTFPLNRFTFSCGIFLALATALVLSEEQRLSRRDVLAMCAGYAVYAVLIFAFCQPFTAQVSMSLVLGAAFIALFAASNNLSWTRRTTEWAVLGLLVVSVALNAMYFYDVTYSPEMKQYVDRGKVLQAYRENPGSIGSNLPKDHFYRTENADEFGYNAQMVYGYPGNSFYFSVMTKSLTDFKTEMGISTERLPSFSFNGYDERAIPTALLGTEYFLKSRDDSRTAAPYGFTRALSSKEFVGYKSPYALPLGFVYDSVINRSEYDKLSTLDKQSTMLVSAVVDDSSAKTVKRSGPATGAVELPYSIYAEKDAELNTATHTLVRTKPKGTVVLGVPRVPDSEYYIEIRKFTNTHFTPLEYAAVADKDHKLSRIERISLGYLTEEFVQPMKLNTIYTSGFLRRTVHWHTPLSIYRYGEDSQLVHLGYKRSGATTVGISPQGVGELKYETLKVYAVPMGGFAASVEKLRAGAMQDIEIKSNTVSGTVHRTKPGLLFLSIPYQAGWSATIDGAPATLLKANTGFMGVEVPAGDHRVELRYFTPGLKAGLILFLIGFVLTCVLIVVSLRRRES